jgi:hypothetical protein
MLRISPEIDVLTLGERWIGCMGWKHFATAFAMEMLLSHSIMNAL